MTKDDVSTVQPDNSIEISVTTSTAEPRDVALDALRGLAVLLMVASGLMPFDANQSLPAWMYHGQEPPPTHVFNPRLPGLTWVDLVFPIFLFCLGAAIPLAYGRRLKEEHGLLRSIGFTVHRAVVLVWFALYRNYLVPYRISDSPTETTWLLALLGFSLYFPMFTRLPGSWTMLKKVSVRIAGYGGSVALLYYLYHDAKKPFTLGGSDIILMVLADMAFFGALIWLCTRERPWLRLGLLPILFASRLAADSAGWVKALYAASHLPYLGWQYDWFFQFDFLKYLFIVIPGTIAGDLLVRWLRERGGEGEEASPESAWAGTSLLVALVTLVVLAGLESREVLPATLAAWALCAVICALTRNPVGVTQRLVSSLMRWGSYFVILGLVFEPFQGGIKKDHATYSYLFLTPGLGFLLLGGLIVLTALYRQKRPVGLLVDMGRNPMIAYVGMDNLILPVLALVPMGVGFTLSDRLGTLFSTPWLIALRALLQTLLLGYIVRLCNRLNLTWRT